jgi:acid phosphatase family membrane protein YuiD
MRYPFLIPVLVMLLTEVTKALVEYWRTGTWHAGIFRTGGMPSSHSAFVTSLLIVVGEIRGIESVEFAIAFVFASVVWYDAVSLRREVGLQAEALNLLQKKQRFTTRVGHSIVEVLAGILFGAIITEIGIALG